jgi:DNA-binding NarL/FixJ family response regulator
VSQPFSRAIRLLVVESSPISSQLLAEAIARDPAIDVVGFSSSASDIVRLVSASAVDVLLVSARMEEDPSRGFSLVRQLRSERPGLKAVVLLDSCKPAMVVEAFRSGASGVFCRSTEIKLLRKCVTAVHNGQIWANSEELGFVLTALAGAQSLSFDNKRLAPLSTREKDVVRCLAEGLTNREIAKTLAISQHTVKNYIFKIFDKLGVSSRVELVFQVLSAPMSLGLVPGSSLQDGAGSRPISRAARLESACQPELQLSMDSETKSVLFLHSGAARMTPRNVSKAAASD